MRNLMLNIGWIIVFEELKGQHVAIFFRHCNHLLRDNWKEKDMFGGTHVGPIVNRPQIWSPSQTWRRTSITKRNTYTMKWHTRISDARRCDQNGAAKDNLWFIWNTNWIPLYLEKWGNLSQVSSHHSHQLKCIEKCWLGESPKNVTTFILRRGRWAPSSSKAYLYESKSRQKNTGIQQQGIAKTKHNKTFTYYKPGSHSYLTL